MRLMLACSDIMALPTMLSPEDMKEIVEFIYRMGASQELNEAMFKILGLARNEP